MPRSRLLSKSELAGLKPAPQAAKQRLIHLSSKVSVGWGWYDEASGVVEWSFKNEDTAPHSVALLRNGYYFGGAFWPVYEANSSGRGASATNPADNFGVNWATDLSPLPDNGVANNSPPLALMDFGAGRVTVNFVFTIAPGATWSMLEGGFSAAMTPSGISLYEVTVESLGQGNPGQFCVGYDPQRVADWDAQTGTSLQGYSPNPSTFNTVEVLVESDAPYDVLPFSDPNPTLGPCASSGGGGQPTSCTSLIAQGAQEIEAGHESQGLSDLIAGIECLFAKGVLADAKGAASRIKRIVEKHL